MILHGWKEIAKYLGSGVRTVQRWEKLGLPVRRPTGGAVVAITKEMDAWVEHAPAIQGSGSSEATASHRFQYQILIADSDQRFLITLSARLVGEGYDLRTARDGFEALAVMREAVPDLLVSDLRMPNMSGFELLTIIRRRFPAMAVVACSSEFAAASDPRLLCDRFVERAGNFTPKLVDTIRELLSQSPLRGQPAKFVVAPAWIPRSINGYFVLTCPDCLRSFSVMTRNAAIGKEAVVQCAHCGVDVRYYIDNSVLPIQDDLAALMQYREERVASGDALVRRARRHWPTRKSLRLEKSA